MPHRARLSRDGLVLLNEHTQVRTRVKYEPDGNFIIETRQDCNPILDQNARLRLATGGQHAMGKHVANWPLVVYQQLCDKMGYPSENPKAWMKWLNDIDHKKLRIWEGKL